MTVPISRNKYARLLSKQMPRVIDSKKDYSNMMAQIKDLISRGDQLCVEERELLKLMVLIVESYEKSHFLLSETRVEPLQILKHLMEAHGHTAKNLWNVIGDKGTASKILSGERAISKDKAKQLADFYQVSAALFI